MEDVSDPPFRYVANNTVPTSCTTEFISSEGLIRDAIKSKKLDIFDYERPIGIQILVATKSHGPYRLKLWIPRTP